MQRRPPISTRTYHLFPTRRSSDLGAAREQFQRRAHGIGCQRQPRINGKHMAIELGHTQPARAVRFVILTRRNRHAGAWLKRGDLAVTRIQALAGDGSAWRSCARRRSEEHTSELQSLMRTSSAAFCLYKNTYTHAVNDSHL